MGFQADLDLSEQQTVEQVENMDRVPAGWYRATCDDHFEDTKGEGGEYVLEFSVQAGAYAGKKLFYRFRDPASITGDSKKGKTEAERQKIAKARIGMLAARFGLVSPDQLGKPGARIDFDKTVGREMVLQVTDQPTEGGGTFTGVAYAGVFPLDHEKIPDKVRKELSLPPARAKSTTPGVTAAPGTNGTGPGGVTTPPKKDDFADII